MTKKEKVEEVNEEVTESTEIDKDAITDILEEYFYDKEADHEKVKRTYMAGKKKIKEEITNS